MSVNSPSRSHIDVADLKDAVTGAVQTGKELKETYSNVTAELSSLRQTVDSSASMLKMKVLSNLIPTELGEYLGELNPLVEAFTTASNLLSGKDIESGPKSIQELINDTVFGKDITKLLHNPVSSSIPLKMEQDRPGFLFNLCMTANGLKNNQEIPVGTEIQVRYHSWKQELVDFLDQAATIPQILPDASITGLMVQLRGSTEKVEYTRTIVDQKYVFKSASGDILELKNVQSMTVTKKDGDKDRQKLWQTLRSSEISTTIEQKLDGEVPLEQYVNNRKEASAEIISTFKKMPYSEKLSPQGRHNAGCYKTAENLYRRLGNGDLKSARPIEKQDSSEEKYNMLSYIPQMIEEKDLLPGTVFWIKKDPSIVDPTSQDSRAGNHFFTYVGKIKESSGKEQPYFVDQFGFGNLARMNGAYPKRYFHQAFAPKGSA